MSGAYTYLEYMSGDLKKLIGGKFFSELYFAVPIQTIFFLKVGLTLTQILTLESVLLAGNLLFQVPTGILADKVGRKWTLVLSAIIRLLAWVPWFIGHSFMYFGIAFFMTGVASALYSGADQALIYDELKTAKRENFMQKIYGFYNASYILATGLAGLIGGLLAAQQTLQQFYFLYKLIIVAEVIGLCLFLSIKESTHQLNRASSSVKGAHDDVLQPLKDGLAQLWTNKKLLRVCALFVLSTPFSVFLLRIYQPYFLKAGVSAAWLGYAIFISSMFTVLVKLNAYKLERWFGVKVSGLIATLLPALLWGAMAVFFNPDIAILLFILMDGAGNIRDPIFADYINRHIDSKSRATVLSAIALFVGGYTLVMQPILGYLAGRSLSLSFIVAGSVILIGSLLFRLNEDHVSA